MKRRDISTLLLAGAAGSAIAPKTAQAQTCTLPCFPRTPSEITAGVTPTNTSYPFGHVLRYGMVEGKTIETEVNTQIFATMMSVAAANNGMDVHFPLGDWCGNFFVNTNNVTIVGEGGVGESDQTCLRPVNTGSTAVTLRFGNGTRLVDKCGVRHVVISGRKHNGAMAAIALGLDGGTMHFSAHGFELVDGERSLDIEASGGQPVTLCFFSHWHIRTGGVSATTRSIRIRRIADPNSYVTAIYFSQGHVNGPPESHWLEADGTGSPGISVSMSQVYVDNAPEWGALLVGGNCRLVSNDLHLDPRGVHKPIIRRMDPIADPISYNPANNLLGTMQHGGQQIAYRSGDPTNIPEECDTFAKKAWIGELFLNMPLHFTNITSAAAPFDETNTLPYLDSATANGPITFNRTSVSIKTIGHGLRVAEGANARQGVVTLAAGMATVTNSSVTANSRIFLTSQSDGGTPGFLRVSSRAPGASFTIRSSSATDRSIVAYEIFEPA